MFASRSSGRRPWRGQFRSKGREEYYRLLQDLADNKRIAVEFLDLAFNQRDPETAARRYLGATYTQHNPTAADGPQGFLALAKHFLDQFPELRLDFKRVLAEDDLVAVHLHGTTSEDDPGIASIDLFRLEDGKLVEHWDVSQPVPESAANDNGMF
jgi:predicted SnoaL-like aldol condensation-catalyzing enzyme